MAIEEGFYPWTEEDHYRAVFEAGEEVLVRYQRYPKEVYDIFEGKVRSVNTIQVGKRKAFWYNVQVPQLCLGGDIPLRDLHPLWNAQQLDEVFRKKVDIVYDSLQKASLERNSKIRILSLLDRISQEIEPKK